MCQRDCLHARLCACLSVVSSGVIIVVEFRLLLENHRWWNVHFVGRGSRTPYHARERASHWRNCRNKNILCGRTIARADIIGATARVEAEME